MGALLQIDTPFILLSNSELANREVNPSTHNRNKYGERGSPYWSPLDGIILPYGLPLTKVEKDGVVIQLITLSIHISREPNLCMIM